MEITLIELILIILSMNVLFYGPIYIIGMIHLGCKYYFNKKDIIEIVLTFMLIIISIVFLKSYL